MTAAVDVAAAPVASEAFAFGLAGLLLCALELLLSDDVVETEEGMGEREREKGDEVRGWTDVYSSASP